MLDYLTVAALVFIINIIPAFMPPTWIILAGQMADNPGFDPLALAVIGAISSTAGRAVLTYYSSFFRRFFTKDLEAHATEIKAFLEKREKELFAGTFIYALSPFPSNLVFIASGLTKTDWKPVFAGFFFGRLIIYYAAAALSVHIFSALNGVFNNEQYVRYAFDVLGIAAAFSVIFVDWKKILGAVHEQKNKRGQKGP